MAALFLWKVVIYHFSKSSDLLLINLLAATVYFSWDFSIVSITELKEYWCLGATVVDPDVQEL